MTTKPAVARNLQLHATRAMLGDSFQLTTLDDSIAWTRKRSAECRVAGRQ